MDRGREREQEGSGTAHAKPSPLHLHVQQRSQGPHAHEADAIGVFLISVGGQLGGGHMLMKPIKLMQKVRLTLPVLVEE